MVSRVNFGYSGLDIDSTIKQLMQAQRASSIDKLLQKKQTLEWQRDDYRTINTKLIDFRSVASNMRLQSTFMNKSATSSHEDIVTVTGTSNANEGLYKIKINRLAEAAQLTSGDVLSGNGDLSKKISDIDPDFTSAGTLTFGGSKGTATITIKPTDTIATLVNSVNAESNYTGVKLSYDTGLDRFFFVSSTTGATDSKIKLQSGDSRILEHVLKLNGDDISDAATTGKTFSSGISYMDGATPPNPNGNQLIFKDIPAEQSLKITYGSDSVSLTVKSSTTVNDLIDQINASDLGKKGVSAYLNENGQLTFFTPDSDKELSFSDETNDNTNIKAVLGLETQSYDSVDDLFYKDLKAEQKIVVKYGDVSSEITVDKDTKISDLISKINNSAAGKAGLTVSLDESGKLRYTVDDPDEELVFTDTTDDGTNIVHFLGVNTPSESDPFTYKEIGDTGVDAEIEFNGVVGNYASNTFSINGMQFTAKKADTSTEVNVSVSQDVDSVYNSIKAFIDKYNEIIDLVNNKVQEKRYRAYTPLMDDQKTEMSDKEVEKWEELARSGLLRNDSLLNNTIHALRMAVTTPLSGVGNGEYSLLSDIGITTSANYMEGGKLYIDEAKLRAALSNNPEQVKNLFTRDDNLDNTDAGDGVARRLYNSMNSMVNSVLAKAGASTSLSDDSDIAKQLQNLNSRISDWETRLLDIEDRYYRQFGAMEAAIMKMQQQSSSLASYFYNNGN